MRTRNILITFALLLVVAMACMAQTPTMVGRFTSLILNGSTVSIYNPSTLCTMNGGVCVATTTLTNAQIKALPTTKIQVVAAPGAGKTLVPLWATIWIDASAGAYTGIDANPQSGISIAYGDWASDAFNFYQDFGSLSTTPGGIVLMPIHQVPNAATLAETPPYPDASNLFLQANTALKVIAWNALDYTGGNAANTMRVTVGYSVVTF